MKRSKDMKKDYMIPQTEELSLRLEATILSNKGASGEEWGEEIALP